MSELQLNIGRMGAGVQGLEPPMFLKRGQNWATANFLITMHYSTILGLVHSYFHGSLPVSKQSIPISSKVTVYLWISIIGL